MPRILLGPQRFRPSVRNTIRSLDLEGPIATINAGWQEREPEDTELDELLDGRTVNLALYRRRHDVHERDPDYAAGARERSDVLQELHAVYTLRLDHAVAAVADLIRRDIRAGVAAAALDDAIAAVREVDRRHLELVGEVHAEFADRLRPADRDVIAEHRAVVAAAVNRCALVAIAGGHIGALLTCLQLFDVGAVVAQMPVVAWSAGAMALAERIVLFNDHAPDGRAYAEVYDAGLGLCRGVVPLPHARRRLDLDDPVRVLMFARRFAPAACVVLDDGVRLNCPDDGVLPPGARVLTSDGRVDVVDEAAA